VVGIGAALVITASVVFGFSKIPSGAGKFFAYFGAALIPTIAIQYRKVMSNEIKIGTFDFVFALLLNSCLVLFISTIILVIIGKI